MGKDAVLKFREAVNSSEDLQEQIRSGGKDLDFVEMAKQFGFEFTTEDWHLVLDEVGGDFSGMELAMVAGGSWFIEKT